MNESPTPEKDAALRRAHQYTTWDGSINELAECIGKLEHQRDALYIEAITLKIERDKLLAENQTLREVVEAGHRIISGKFLSQAEADGYFAAYKALAYHSNLRT